MKIFNRKGAVLFDEDMPLTELVMKHKGNLQNANLMEFDLNSLDLRNGNFENADLTGVNFNGADLYKCNFTGALIIHSDMTNSNLQHANFTNATMDGTHIGNAQIDGANFKNTRFYVKKQSLIIKTATIALVIYCSVCAVSALLALKHCSVTTTNSQVSK